MSSVTEFLGKNIRQIDFSWDARHIDSVGMKILANKILPEIDPSHFLRSRPFGPLDRALIIVLNFDGMGNW